MSAHRTRPLAAIAVLILHAAAAPVLHAGDALAAPVHGFTLVATYLHDPNAFTQGLVYKDGYLYESTGLYSESTLRKVDIQTGLVLKRFDLPGEYFGEGLAEIDGTFYQITWEEQTGFKYVEEEQGFNVIESYTYPYEGWGLTTDGTRLIASDGSDTLRFIDPNTQAQLSYVVVRDGATPVRYLNELEYIQGKVYANIISGDRVAVIDPANGVVTAWLDLSGLRSLLGYLPDPGPLNGLAFDPAHLRLFATGKRWPKLFAVDTDLLHAAGAPDGDHDQGALDGPVLIHPNPCRGETTLSFTKSVTSPLRLRLCDIQGRLVFAATEFRHAGATFGSFPLVLSGIAPGAYFLSIEAPGLSCARKVHIAG